MVYVFNRHDEDQVKIKFDRFIEKTKGKIEAWSVKGSGWVLDKIMVVYVNVARYQPLRGGTYLPLPANLAKKKAIINLKRRNNQCLRWTLTSDRLKWMHMVERTCKGQANIRLTTVLATEASISQYR